MTNEGSMTKDQGVDRDVVTLEEVAFWDGGETSCDSIVRETAGPMPRRYDLEERTARSGESIITFAKRVPSNPVNNRLIDQLVGAGTSVGANYCEADEGVSRKDFMNKIGICKKEAKETRHFLRMVATAEPQLKDAARGLWKEATELTLIFAAIMRKR